MAFPTHQTFAWPSRRTPTRREHAECTAVDSSSMVALRRPCCRVAWCRRLVLQVRNIVHGSQAGLQQLYGPRLNSGSIAKEAGLRQMHPLEWTQRSDAGSRAALISRLPMVSRRRQLCLCRGIPQYALWAFFHHASSCVQGLLSALAGCCGECASVCGAPAKQRFAIALADRPDYQRLLLRSIGQIVRASSRCACVEARTNCPWHVASNEANFTGTAQAPGHGGPPRCRSVAVNAVRDGKAEQSLAQPPLTTCCSLP